MNYQLEQPIDIAWPVYQATWHISSPIVDDLSPLSRFVLLALYEGYTKEAIVSMTQLPDVLIDEEIQRFEEQQLTVNGEMSPTAKTYGQLLKTLLHINKWEHRIAIDGIGGQVIPRPSLLVVKDDVPEGIAQLKKRATVSFFDNPNYENSFSYIWERLSPNDRASLKPWEEHLEIHIQVSKWQEDFALVSVDSLPILKDEQYSFIYFFFETYRPTVTLTGMHWYGDGRSFEALHQLSKVMPDALSEQGYTYLNQMTNELAMKESLERTLFDPLKQQVISPNQKLQPRHDNELLLTCSEPMALFTKNFQLQYPAIQLSWHATDQTIRHAVDVGRLRNEVLVDHGDR